MNLPRSTDFLLLAALLAAIPAPMIARATDDAEELAALRQRLQKLEAEVAALKERLAKGDRAPLQVLPQFPPPPAGEIPANWQPREFNGVRYFVVPLGCE